jgi:ABC-type spermidine/putrescine transport system permease subunit II
MCLKVAIVSSAIKGKISSIMGYFWGVLMAAVLFVPTESGPLDLSVKIGILVILATCVYGVINGLRIKRRIFRFKNYAAFLSLQNITSIDALAAASGKTAAFVKKDLERMIRKRFFVNAVIDHAANELVIKGLDSFASGISPEQVKAATCKSCGASNRIIIGQVVKCPYCGSYMD